MKEKVLSKLDNNGLKKLWEEIYDVFSNKGKEGVKSILKNKIDELQKEFNEVKSDIEKQLGG